MMIRQLRTPLLIFFSAATIALLHAQQKAPDVQLPNAPASNFAAQLQALPTTSTAPHNGSTTERRLTLMDAEKLAIHDNPRVSAAHLLALVQHQVVRETHAAELPAATANVTAVDAKDGSRLSAGSLTASRLLEHAGAGAGFTLLITDFGKTGNLVASAKLDEKAQDANALATTEDIVLAADQAFYNALEAQAQLQVAQEAVRTRQATQAQVSSMAKNKLKSDLDTSFADVNLSQAQLLELDAQSHVDATMAALDAVLGLDRAVQYDLVDSDAMVDKPPADAVQLTQLALQQRPDLQALNLSQQSYVKYSHAERDQMLPSITAAGTAGSVPVRPAAYYSENWWGAIGVNMSIPIFNGFLYSAQAKEAELHAKAKGEQGRELRDNIVRDVRTAWLAANTAYQRMGVTRQMLDQANMALKLAQTRYKLGLSSIVELSQAQFQQTDAAVSNTNARYGYRLALATLNYETGTGP